MRSTTETLIAAMRILARDILSGDGVANAAISEAADRLEEQQARIAELEQNGPEMQRGVNGAGAPWMGTMRQVLEDYKTAAATEAKLGDEARAALDDLRISRRALRDKVLDLMARYWELAYREGAEGINLADEANEVIHAVRNLLAGGA